MFCNIEVIDDVKIWIGGLLNYKEGFFIQLVIDELVKGINEEVVCVILVKCNELEWMLEFCLNVYCVWLEMEELYWLKVYYDKLNYQDYSYYLVLLCGNCDDICVFEFGVVQ